MVSGTVTEDRQRVLSVHHRRKSSICLMSMAIPDIFTTLECQRGLLLFYTTSPIGVEAEVRARHGPAQRVGMQRD
jgi:hypothetical protein